MVAKEKWTGIPAVEMADLMRKAQAAGMSMAEFMANPPTAPKQDPEVHREIARMSQMMKNRRQGRGK